MADVDRPTAEVEDQGVGFRSGYVAVVGRPNVGKSTLLNGLLQQTVSATSPKPQTTRTNQLAILNLPEAQIVFIDTPGIHEPHDRLGQLMDSAPDLHLGDADVILAMFDVSQPVSPDDLRVADRLNGARPEIPLVVALNKSDAVQPQEREERAALMLDLLPHAADSLIISALDPQDRDRLLQAVLKHLPPGPRYFPAEQVTDRYERDIAADLIRAAAMERLRDELPHSIAVRIDEFKEREDSQDFIKATIFVERESQKGIVVGKGGQMIRSIGIAARQQIESMAGRDVYLELRVKTLPAWRSDEKALARLGLGPNGER